MLTSEQLEIRELAREFADGEIRPHAARWDEQASIDVGVFRSLGELGFLGMRAEERYGGLGLDLPTYLVALEQLAWGDPSVALAVAIHNGPVTWLLQRHGTDDQKDAWIPRMASGDVLTAFALSEPDAGSDPGSLATQAVPEEGGWRLRGEKRWITNGGLAGLVVVFARTPDEGISAFLVDPGQDGYAVTETETTMGFRASETARLALDLHVPTSALLGAPGRGLAHALEALDVGRLGIAALAVGISQAALEHAVRYATERRQFGRSLAEFGAIQGKLADIAAGTEAVRAFVAEVGHAAENAGGLPSRTRAAMAKMLATEHAVRAADEAVQIFGGYGYMRDYPVEKLLRDAKGTEIFEGTNQIMRYVISRGLTQDRDG